MEKDYDRKFEEMKNYIPFLESMIQRLESTSGKTGCANPRQAQLDKIRSLRDLLLDKKKRMKMDNLLKCEQVLVNLCAKVKQRDTLPGIKPVSEIFPSTSSKSDSDLHSVRKKFQTVMSIKREETLPEIARLSETEESCAVGSKEPALFQRRPNKAQTPSRLSSAQSVEEMSQKSSSKRNYTRVLVSPEPNSQRWSIGEEDTPRQPLFSRRSPTRTPKMHSPSYNKERRKSSHKSKYTKDLNITLNVPQDSLDSLNTDDIVSRIIHCDDNDVDIDSLRDLRTQILGELKQTGASEDISDVIMKSYKTKKKKNVLNVKKRDEVEEGELSDSESEAIESIYGSLVVLDKDKTTSVPCGTKNLNDKDKQSRKIQICLVINSDNDNKGPEVTKATEVSDFKMFDDVDIAKPTEEDKKTQLADDVQLKIKRLNVLQKEKKMQDLNTIDEDDQSRTLSPPKISSDSVNPKSAVKGSEKVSNNNNDNFNELSNERQTSNSEAENILDETKELSTEIQAFKANFYKPLQDNVKIESSKNTPKISDETQSITKESSLKCKPDIETKATEMISINSGKKNEKEEERGPPSASSAKCIPQNKIGVTKSEYFSKDVEIPLLNTEPVVAAAPTKNVLSEIDILQALKNEILSESLIISCADGSTPLLHQPKVTKVAGAQKIINKKRISLENYKQKSNSTSTSSFCINEPNALSRYNDYGKKQSLKLTKEECERFNFPKKLALGDSSDDDDNSIDDNYTDLAPQSPENEDISEAGSLTPIIIPVEPIKPNVVASTMDVDMRVMPISSPNSGRSLPVPPPPPLMSIVLAAPVPPPCEIRPDQNKRPLLMDPRVRRDFNKTGSKESPNPHTNLEISRSSNYADLTPSRAPSMTPNPRSYEMTPSHQSFDFDDISCRKHVYAPIASFEPREREKCDGREIHTHSWETNFDASNEGRKSRWEERDENNSRSYWEEKEWRSKRWDESEKRGSSTRDIVEYQKSRYEHSDRYQHSRSDYTRQECPRTPSHPFGRADCPTTPNSLFGRHETPITPIHPFGRSDGPTTPSHPFGQTEHPQTPSHPFGRTDVALTPSHPFGRTECPMTPSHPFGRSECPMTPSHPFGRSECPMTPSHPFGRHDMNLAPMTPTHPFGRSDYQQNQPVPIFKDPRLNRSTEYDSPRRKNDKDRDNYRDRKRSDHCNRSHSAYRTSGHERSVDSNDKGKKYEQKKQIRDQTPHRESSDSRGLPKDSERPYTNWDASINSAKDNCHENVNVRMNYQRASSVGRAHPPNDRYHRSSSKAPKIGNYQETNNDHSLSVKPQSGRPFVIDTSVNRTFQEFLKDKGLQLQVFDHSFKSRRQRAASVGRTREVSVGLSRCESSVGTTLLKPTAANSDSLDYKRIVDFVRARSMGRDSGDKKQQKSLNEIKVDFQSYSATFNKKEDNRNKAQKENAKNFRSRKDIYQMQQHTYSPQRNQRDPRMKQEQHSSDRKYRNRNEDKKSGYGIVYSSDNIAKGAILGSGYAVKNYKIPKIKRPIEEIKRESKVTEMHEKATVVMSKVNEKNKKDEKTKFVGNNTRSDDKKLKETMITPKKNKNVKSEILEDMKRSKEKNKAINEKMDDKANTSDDNIKRVTRSGKKNEFESPDSEDVFDPKTRRVKKSIIESDSDSEITEPKKVDINRTKVTQSYENVDLFNSSFDDLGIFPNSSGTAEVMANINDLIANLDELEDNKSAEDSNQFTQELNLENMLENINSPEAEYLKEKRVEESFEDISEVINKDLKGVNTEYMSNEKKDDISSQAVAESTSSKTMEVPIKNIPKTEEQKVDAAQIPDFLVVSSPKQLDSVYDLTNRLEKDSSNDQNTQNTEAIVSTTGRGSGKKKDDKLKNNTDERSSTPDSTINTSDIVQKKSCVESFPDSTIDENTESSEITSTNDSRNASKDSLEPLSLNNEGTSEIDSIGNLLSILENKTKIKELLSMLGEKSCNNDKIKKKLEKLSELVSDEEDTNDIIDADTMPNYRELPKVDENKELLNKPILPTDPSEAQLDTYEQDKEKVPVQDELAGREKYTEKQVKAIPGKIVKSKVSKKTRKRKLKAGKKILTTKPKPITRSVAPSKPEKPKVSRELRRLHDDIKEMFLNDDVLNPTGVRMCRLAKLVDEKQQNQDAETNTVSIKSEPIVVLHKFKEKEVVDEKTLKIRKKPGPKPKSKDQKVGNENNSNAVNKSEKIETLPIKIIRRKPGPKSKTKIFLDDSDPYTMESDAVSDITTPQPSEDLQNSSDSENESLASSKSFESTEALADLKKKKRKRRSGWSSGVIIKKKKKIESKQKESLAFECSPDILLPKLITYPDKSCFVDKTYCFYKNISSYPCRLCEYSSSDIVHHYKKQHPHSEVPLSKINPTVAREAIEQSDDIDFNVLSRLPSEKFTCLFCYKEIYDKTALLETFFWHVVSMHTGEYKQICPECVNVVPCLFNVDIPPPPKEMKGQLIGYICGKCNFTQISLENLKIHVIVQHNDEQTEVYTINLSFMTKKTLAALLKRQSNIAEPRLLRSRTTVSATGVSDDRSNDRSDDRSDHQRDDHSDDHSDDRSDDRSDLTDISYKTYLSKKDPDIQDRSTPKISIYSKLTFESDDATDLPTENVKIEKKDNQEICDDTHNALDDQEPVSDILDYLHFKISLTDAGAKEYICCINGNDNHYKTALLISMNKHVQTKHSENWDGYCFICKVIVMPQGKHSFRDCLQHMLDKHFDSFPVLQNLKSTSEITTLTEKAQVNESTSHENLIVEEQASTKSYINVRPLSDLTSKETGTTATENESDTLPKIQSVISLGAPCLEPSSPTPTPLVEKGIQDVTVSLIPHKEVKYEEAQAQILSKKHPVVLDAMLVPEKLIQFFKCAGRFCSFTTDSAEAALVHASTHQRIGGENALLCAYCDSDSKGNGIDLITHVFKSHGYCQYTCGHCFYRAAASQLVRAHMIRVHGAQHAQSAVYKNSVVVTTNDDKAEPLPRDLAVEYYVCAAVGCKFKSFMHGKFSEHVLRHGPPYQCHICLCTFPIPIELVQHFKTHGLMLYQCAWCVFGAENEAELLTHASAKHPSQIPQAYLRVITQKDGNSSKMMVLPLAQLNKSFVNVKVLTAVKEIDDPSREARRSIDLEKLIGSVILPTMDATATLTVVSGNDSSIECAPSLETDSEMIDQTPQESIVTDDSDMATLIPEPPHDVTPVIASAVRTEDQQLSPLIAVLKTEPTEESRIKDNLASVDVICLDSDEEDSKERAQNVISLSDDDTSTSKEKLEPVPNYETFSPSDLYKCPGCTIVYRSSATFKRHIMICLGKCDTFNCGHCAKPVKDLDELQNHYIFDHGNCPKLRSRYIKDHRPQNYVCGICDCKDSSLNIIKSHLKSYHGVKNVIVALKQSDTGGVVYTVSKTPENKLKRKLSAGSVKEKTPPNKRKRYSPHDLNQLPTRPIFDEPAFCSECEFSTKVLSNLVRHLQQHADALSVPSTVPVNPVPHLESNEKHFDKMINLASSSVANKSDKLSRSDGTPSVTLLIPLEAAANYPKYVPDRQRNTCGAKGCSYISLDENMLKCHWETLHAELNSFHCVHCPPYQQLDTTRPLTSARIIGHLKMHDVRLYACSACSYYHYKRLVLEKHLTENHIGSGQIVVVRQEATNDTGVTQASPAAPTMDLKPWQCGLCKYRNMLRQEVIEHCSKAHNSKWQFKCPNCPFKGSTLENVCNHQSRVHPESRDDVYYYYYREGSIPNDTDGIPRWQKQHKKMNPEAKVKTETEDETSAPPVAPIPPASSTTPTPITVDLDLVKKEIVDPEIEVSIEQLYKRFGPLCNPNGVKYKCPLCQVVMEDNKDAMQSHLYEELQYRKWGCSICMYKAFHKTGLKDHMIIEHSFRQVSRHDEIIELPTNVNIEKWVTKVIEHQSDIIAKNKENLTKQKIQVPKTDATVSVTPTTKTTQNLDKVNFGGKEIENLSQAFGKFGSSKNIEFCCPKCDFQTRDESEMKNHLELELNKIRWRCSSCSDYSQNYHEAQLHCKTCKNLRPGQSARPTEAVRDPVMRAAWVNAVIYVQKKSMKQPEDTSTASAKHSFTDQTSTSSSHQSFFLDTIENSLLSVRYEEKVPTPEEEMLKRKISTPSTASVAPAATTPDSDDERLVIDVPATAFEAIPKRKGEVMKQCKFCNYTSKYNQAVYTHMLRHYNLMPLTCTYCGLYFHKSSMLNHLANSHPGEIESYTKTILPTGPPVQLNLYKKKDRRTWSDDNSTHKKEKQRNESAPKKDEVKSKEDGTKSVCLVCEKAISEAEKSSHFHDKIPVTYAKKGDVVVKCCICLALLLDSNAMQEHHSANHRDVSINYAYFKLNYDTREVHYCGHCKKGFKFIRDLRTHHNTVHGSLPFKSESKPFTPGSHDLLDNEPEATVSTKDEKTHTAITVMSCDDDDEKKNNDDSTPPLPKRVAIKSTTKLPNRTVARKSTTKLPFFFEDSDSEPEEFSYYGRKPTTTDALDNVNLVMSLSSKNMPGSITCGKLNELMEIYPKLIVKDCKNK